MFYGYARVSTRGQVKGNSLAEQRQQLMDRGCDEVLEEQYTGTTTDADTAQYRRYTDGYQTGQVSKVCHRRSHSYQGTYRQGDSCQYSQYGGGG